MKVCHNSSVFFSLFQSLPQNAPGPQFWGVVVWSNSETWKTTAKITYLSHCVRCGFRLRTPCLVDEDDELLQPITRYVYIYIICMNMCIHMYVCCYIVCVYCYVKYISMSCQMYIHVYTFIYVHRHTHTYIYIIYTQLYKQSHTCVYNIYILCK